MLVRAVVAQTHCRHRSGCAWTLEAAGGACLVAAKHQSAWDTFGLVPIFRDPAFVLKAELLRLPLYGWFCRKFEHIAIERETGPAALRRMLRAAKSRIGEGREVVIFPEGTRRRPGAAPDYKPGRRLAV